MNFNSLAFLVYLAVIVGGLQIVRDRGTRRTIMLVASYLFYASWSPLYLVLLALVGLVTQRVGAWAHVDDSAKRQSRAYTGVAILVGVMVLFRSSAVLVPISRLWTQATGMPMSDGVPLGLSFYVFEAISYLIEVGKGREKAYGFWDFQLFMVFFPHLLSGPIMKAKEMIGQFDDAKAFRAREWLEGCWKIASGLFMKVVLADELAPKLDPWFSARPGVLHAADVVLLGFGFAVQMYCDFAGYSRIAIGSGLLCGVRLVENFNYPFLATSPADFWNRWHISLSRWLRDYVFLAFVGTRRTLGRFCTAAMLSMVLCGLWHGLSLKFLLWGAFHGVAIAGYHVYRRVSSRALAPRLASSETLRRLYAVLGWASTLLVLFPGWILFRTNDLRAAATMFRALGYLRGRSVPGNVYLHVGALFAAVIVFPWLLGQGRRVSSWLERFVAGRAAIDVAVGLRFAATVAVTMIYMGTSGSFVYFQF